MKIGVVIINFNGEDDTKKCLKSIERFYSSQENFLVILVDNDSFNVFGENFLKNLKINVLLIRNQENKGFAEGCNIGIRKALDFGCDYVALINNDTIFVDNSLLSAIASLNGEQDLGILGLVNYFLDNPEEVWQSGFISRLNSGRTYSLKLPKSYDSNDIAFVDYVPGSSIIIKSEVFNKVGLLDPKYFAYFEEYDFCVRTKKAGYKIGVLLGSKILHKVGRSSDSPTKLYLRTRNKLLFYKQNANNCGFLMAFFKHLGISVLRIMFAQREKKALFKAMVWGIKDYYNGVFYYGSLNKIVQKK